MDNFTYKNNRLFEIRKSMLVVFLYCMAALITLFMFFQQINNKYAETSQSFKRKQILLTKIHTASPALTTKERNIAFETGNRLSDVPASYFIRPLFFESYEAISKRIATGQIRCEIIKNKGK